MSTPLTKDAITDAAIRSAIAESKQFVEVHIRFNVVTGDCECVGPMAQPVLFLGMLDLARLNLMRYLSRKGSPPEAIESKPTLVVKES